jgi:hypothetical protein
MLPRILKALALTALLFLPSLAVSPALESTEQATVHSATNLLAGVSTARESASVFASGNYELNDHYGNPANFKRYIIRKPPVHA